jgi:hypothetical protein
LFAIAGSRIFAMTTRPATAPTRLHYFRQLGANEPQAFARVFVDQVEDAYAAAIMCPCAHEVVAPYMVRMHGPEPHTRTAVEPQSSTCLLLLRNLQPLATPDTLHAILAHPPAGTLQQCRDPAIPVTAVLAGKLDDRLREYIFVFTPMSRADSSQFGISVCMDERPF